SYGLAAKALQVKSKEEIWPGKLTVYLVPDRERFAAFIRRVEKRRVEEEDAGSRAVEGDVPHVAVTGPRGKTGPNLESPASIQMAAALLQRKAGVSVPLPEWLVLGFGRATVWRTMPADKAVQSERRLARTSIAGKGRTPADVWGGTLEAEEAVVLRASLAE